MERHAKLKGEIKNVKVHCESDYEFDWSLMFGSHPCDVRRDFNLLV
jgi:hypothetical protein